MVGNTTSSNYRVSVFPVLLTQNLTGAFDFSSAPRDLSAARLALTASPASFGLAPGQQQQVELHWNLLPQGRRWVAPGVVFQGVPQGQRTTLHVITRLLSVNFLRLPGPVTVAGTFVALFPEQFKPRVLRFVARVKNLGNDFTAPSDGRLVIHDSSGSSVFSEPWKGIQMLPGATVDFPIDVTKVFPAGRYTATVTMKFGGPHSKTAPFTLVGPNQLPTPAITIRDFNASGEIGSPAQVTARINSTGTAPASLALHLYLGNSQSVGAGANALATGTVSYTHLAPGTRVRLSRSLGKALRKGSYRVVATWTDATGAPHVLEAEFTPTAARSWLGSIWSFIKEDIVLFVGLIVLALLIALATIARRMRSRQQAIEAELVATRAQLRNARVRGRAAVTEHRLSARAAKAAANGADGEELSPPAETAADVPPEPAAPVEPPPVTAPADPTATPTRPPSDWIPPWEREGRESPSETEPPPSSEKPGQ